MRSLDRITNSVNISLSKLQEFHSEGQQSLTCCRSWDCEVGHNSTTEKQQKGSATRGDKEIKEIQIGKQKVKLFADDMILYIEHPKYASRRSLELINESSKVAIYNSNT